MPAKSISFGTLHFSKKGDAEDFLNSILKKYDVGDKVSEEDSQVLRHALALHSKAAEKIGAGISSFSVGSAEFGTKCFWVNRIDNTSAKFSVSGCVYEKRTPK